MRRAWKVAGLIAGLAAAGLLGGFVVFADAITRATPNVAEAADGIVVLTGGQARIKEGVRLLQAGKGRRLLISGAHRQTSREDLQRAVRLKAGSLFECCVNVGYQALDTTGNAVEARNWASEQRFSTLIIVTSSYHMPRGLIELQQAMPDVRLIAYPVVPRHFRAEAWWAHSATFRLMLSEYLKYLPALARSTSHGLMPGRHEALPIRAEPAGPEPRT